MMRRATAGLSLVEITIVVVVLGILATAALPMAEVTARRRDELELRRVLREVRTAIDRFAEDRARRRPGRNWHEHYPRDLDELVEARYLRRVPRDPMTRSREWRLIGTGDPPDEADLSTALPEPGEGAALPGSALALLQQAPPLDGPRVTGFPADPGAPTSLSGGGQGWGELELTRPAPGQDRQGRGPDGLATLGPAGTGMRHSGNLFDLRSTSSGVAMDGSRYADW